MTKTTRRQLRTIRRRRLALALAGVLAVPAVPAVAQNLPDTGNVTSGTANITQPTATTMVIDQSTHGAIIDWGSFSIGSGYGVTFNVPDAGAVTLNRVIGFGYAPNMSNILGSLTSNGQLFLINPSGILFSNTATVNVASLVASTIDISDADFLDGLTTNRFRFATAATAAGEILNDGQITAADGGTIALVGARIENGGTLTANHGSVVMGATQDVTLDFFGDGLTQVTVAGNGMGVSNCVTANCNGGITSTGNAFALGGNIELRTNTMDGATAGTALFVDPANGGRIWIAGNVSAQTDGNRRGTVTIDAGQGNIDLGGLDGKTGNVSAVGNDAGEQAGTITLRGNQLFTHLCYGTGPTDLCVANNRLGLVNASAYGTGGSAGEIHVDVNRLYHGGVLQAVANDGSGGLIDINAIDAEIYNWVFAYGNNGAGGTIDIDSDSLLLFRGQQAWLGGPGTAYWSASLLAYGTTTGGTVNIDTTDLVVTDLGNVTPQSPDLVPVINVTGQLGGNGGTISVNAGDASIDDTLFADASGEGNGGSIVFNAGSLYLAGGMVANGGDGQDGDVATTASSELVIAGTAYVGGDTWLLQAPEIALLASTDIASGTGSRVADGAISAALDRGTSVDLVADASLAAGASGHIRIGNGVAISHTSADAVALALSASAGVYGGNFTISATNGPLDMRFTGNAGGTDPDHGYVSFYGAVLVSSGGDIDLAADGKGVYLEYGALSSGTGHILLQGSGDAGVQVQSSSFTSSTGDISFIGSNALENGAGVRLADATISSAEGDILVDGASVNGLGTAGVAITDSAIYGGRGLLSIHGDGDGAATGVLLNNVVVHSGAGNIDVHGTGGDQGNGVAASTTGFGTTDGSLSIRGYGGYYGVRVVDGDLYTSGGGIAVHGEGGGGRDGSFIQAILDSDGGSIDLYGSSDLGRGLYLAFASDTGLYSHGGSITLTGHGTGAGTILVGPGYGTTGIVDSEGGLVTVTGTAVDPGGFGVAIGDMAFYGYGGDIVVHGDSDAGTGVQISGNGGLYTTTGNIELQGNGGGTSGDGVALFGVSLATGGGAISITGESDRAGVTLSGVSLYTAGGDIHVHGEGGSGHGTDLQGMDIASGGGAIDLYGSSAYAIGLYASFYSGSGIASGGGAIAITGHGASGGVALVGSGYGSSATIAGNGGMINVFGSATDADGVGVLLEQILLDGGSGAVSVLGSSAAGRGIEFGYGAGVSTTTGDIALAGIGVDVGLALYGGEISTGSGHLDLRGLGTGTDASGLVIGSGVNLATDGGGIELTGEGTGSGAGLRLMAGSAVDAGDSLVVLRGASGGGGDAIALAGTIHSDYGVNLRPGGVDAFGNAVDHTLDEITLGGTLGFTLDSAELALIDAPQLVVGSAQHEGAIRVLAPVAIDGNLTLQNQGGAGGIAIGSGLDVGTGVLGLLTGGSITQTGAGAIVAHSLLASAAGDVLLGDAQNDVASTTLAGSSGGAFQFLDGSDLAIGSVDAAGFDTSAGQLVTSSGNGINAGGDVLVRNLAGDLLLGGSVTGADVDLITAGTFQNPDGAGINATGAWRIWASTWVGEERGGLAGSGPLPNLYGCTWLGSCVVTVSATDSHFIYTLQPVAVVTIDSATREYGLANPAFTYSVAGLILGDGAEAVQGTPATSATITSNVGNYAINGGFASAAGYTIQFVGGTLSITPATLVFTADELSRFFGAPNPPLTGTYSGFRNGDTVSVFGASLGLFTDADSSSPAGYYPVYASGTALNYVIVQAPGNETALQVLAGRQSSSLPTTFTEFVSEPVETYLYESNISQEGTCPLGDPASDPISQQAGEDNLGRSWLKVRKRMQLSNCFDSQNQGGCQF